MTPFVALIRVFMRDLVRRRMLWLLAVVAVGIVAVNYAITRTMQQVMESGQTWDVATRRAASELDSVASTLRTSLNVIVVLLAAQVAPESRRNGTAQFVLSVGVRRNVLAAAQLTALALVLAAGVLIAHAGFSVAGLRVGALTGLEVGLAWLGLMLPLLALGAAVFSISLTLSPLETYLVFLGVPFFTRVLPSFAQGFPRGTPRTLVRALDNLSLFFPQLDAITPWPHLSYGQVGGAPYPSWGWPAAHFGATVAFWCVLGIWLHRHHDFGSRTAVK